VGCGPQPAQLFVQGRGQAAEAGHGLLERRHARGVFVSDRGRQSVEQKTGRGGGLGGGGNTARRLRCLAQAAARQTARKMAGQYGVEVGGPGHAQVEGLEAAGGTEQQRRRVATSVLGVGDLGPDHVHLGALKVSKRARLAERGDRRRRMTGRECAGRDLPPEAGCQPDIGPRVGFAQADRPRHGHTSMEEVYHASPWSSSLVGYQ